MKKVLIICICVVLLASMCGCGKKKSTAKADSSDPLEGYDPFSLSSLADNYYSQDDSSTTVTNSTSASTTSANKVTTPAKPKLKPTPNIPYSALSAPDSSPELEIVNNFAIDWVNALKNKDTSKLKYHIFDYEDKTLKGYFNVNFSDIKISYISGGGSETHYKVIFNADSNNNQLFKKGQNVFLLSIYRYGNRQYYTAFRPYEAAIADVDVTITGLNWYTNFYILSSRFKANFAKLTPNDSIVNPTTKKSKYDEILNDAILAYILATDNYPVTQPAGFAAYAAKDPYLRGIDIAKCNLYDKTGRIDGMQYDYNIDLGRYNVASAKRLPNSQYEIVLDFFNNSNPVNKVKTVKIVISDNPDDDIKIVSETVLFNSGKAPALSGYKTAILYN